LQKYLLGILICAPAFGQAPAARPEFEVASIKPSAPMGTAKVLAGMHVDASQVSWASLSLNDYLGSAYRVRSYQISGPDFMASERFDITAKIPAGAVVKDVPAMLQALLEDRFQMKMHREDKDFPVYGLVVGKGGVKMQDSPAEPGADTKGADRPAGANVAAVSRPGGVTVNFGSGAYFTFGGNKFEGKKLTASAMADVLARFTVRPVVDMTNLKGKYDFVLEFSPDDFRAMQIRAAIAAGGALPPQVVQSAIDHCEKAPTEN
jgi:uncharacterized protein (TIGR03435 family)